MTETNLIVISGSAATSKTTLGKFLSKDLELPYFYKDQFAVSHTTPNIICEELLLKSVSHISKDLPII